MFKKIIALILAGFITISSLNVVSAAEKDYVRYKVHKTSITTEIENRPVIVIRVGEFPNKPGKRTHITEWFKNRLDTNKYVINKDGTLSEYYINKEIAKSIVDNLRILNPNIDVILQDTKGSDEDLNNAGKIAMKNKNLKVYLSVHTNASNTDANGYMFLTGKDSTYANNIKIENISNNLDDSKIKQRVNNYNVNYIGELNEIDKNILSMVGEFGFYTNPKDLLKLTNAKYVNDLGKSVAIELNNILIK